MVEITMYGAQWCGDCRRAKQFLDSHRVPFAYVDLEQDAAAAEMVRSLNDGRQRIPTLVFADGTVLSVPTNSQLAARLGVPLQPIRRD